MCKASFFKLFNEAVNQFFFFTKWAWQKLGNIVKMHTDNTIVIHKLD